MPAYDYLCMDPKGQTKRGSVEAQSSADLHRWMTENGLFLISWNVHQEPGLSPTLSPAQSSNKNPILNPVSWRDITDDDKLSPLLRKWHRTMAFCRQPKVFAMIFILLALCAAGDFIYFTRFAATNPFLFHSKPSELLIKVASIKLGDKRADVEKVLTHRSAEQPSATATRYSLGPNMDILIDFDSAGGVGNPDNHVTTLPTL